MSRFNAKKTHCKHGHPFDKANTYIYSRNGRRACRTCTKRIHHKNYREHLDDWKNRAIRASERAWRRRAELGPCVICGEDRIACLDLHHIDPATKEAKIAVLILAASDEKFNREKAKCVVLCANCHRCWHAGQGRA